MKISTSILILMLGLSLAISPNVVMQAFADPSPAILPQTPTLTATTETFILTKARLRKLDKAMVEYGGDVTLVKSVTGALGLTRNGESLIVRQLSSTESKVPLKRHAFQRIPGRVGFILIVSSVGSARDYVVDGKQELIAAVIGSKTVAPVAIPVAQAQQELKEELAYWAKIADALQEESKEAK